MSAKTSITNDLNAENIQDNLIEDEVKTRIKDEFTNSSEPSEGMDISTIKTEEQVHYVSNDESGQPVTFVCPESTIPLLSGNEGVTMNLVELQGAGNSLELGENTDSINYEQGIVIQRVLSSQEGITVMTDDQLPVSLLSNPAKIEANIHETTYFSESEKQVILDESVHNPNDENTTYYDDTVEQVIQIPTNDIDGDNHTLTTITLPLSWSHVSMLQGLQLPLEYSVGDSHSETMTLRAAIDSDTEGQHIVLSNLPHSLVGISSSTVSAPSEVLTASKSNSFAENQIHNIGSDSILFSQNASQGIKPIVVKTVKSNVIPNSNIQKHDGKIITVVSKNGENRSFPDVLPSSREESITLATNQNRKVPVPVRPYRRYVKRGRGRGAKNFLSLSKDSTMTNTSHTSILKDSSIVNDNPEDIVVDMMLPTGNTMSVKLLSDSPITKPPAKRGRKRKRRGTASGTYVINSTGRRPGRPRKVETLIEGPHGARMIHTGPDPSDVEPKMDCIEESQDPFESTNIQDTIKSEPVDVFEDPYYSDDQGLKRKRLPPRKRGTRYEKMIESLKKDEFDESVYSEDGDDFLPDYSSQRKNTFKKARGKSGPGKRGRPRKNFPAVTNSHNDGLDPSSIYVKTGLVYESEIPNQYIQESFQNLGNVTDQEKDKSSSANLLISFQRPDTGQIVVQQVPMLFDSPNLDINDCGETITADIETDIPIDESIPQSADADLATLVIRAAGYVEDHTCEECGKVIPFVRDYIRHLKTEHNLRPFECKQCGKTFTSTSALEDHYSVHELELPHRCNYCGIGFSDVALLKAHRLEHQLQGPFQCEKCEKTFMHESQFKKHIATHGDVQLFTCNFCDENFAFKDSLYAHMRVHSADKPYICDICRLGFVTSSGLNRHRKVHLRGQEINNDDRDITYKCSICQANFSHKDSLDKHTRTLHLKSPPGTSSVEEHNVIDKSGSVVEQLQKQLNEGYAPKNSELYDEPKRSETLEGKNIQDPFACGICDQAFTDVDILCEHYSNCHTGDQDYYCNVCSVGCSEEIQLTNHSNVHLREEKLSSVPSKDGGEFACNICNKRYKKLRDLNKHQKTHNQIKHFNCMFCNAAFPIKSALDKHILVHTGERPFKCDVCLKSFRQSAALVRHKLWTHRLKNQNKCELCAKTFFTPALLSYHLDVHGEEGQKVKKRLQEMSENSQNKLLDEDLEFSEDTSDMKLNKTCEYCQATFPTTIALLSHKLTHKLSASYICDICQRTFREKRYLQKHKMTHRGVKIWKCDICRKAFRTKLTLVRHSHVHLREALRPDNDLLLISNDGSDAKMIQTSTLPLNLRCDECNIGFDHKSHYVRHKLLHSGTPLLKCGLCDKLFVHKSDIIRHKVMHSFMFTCDICHRNFHKRSLFLLHKKKHVDDKPFKCNQCEKSFSTSGNYRIHKRIHSGEKPFHCDICGYRCSQSGRLFKHKRMHTGEKPFNCSYCNKHFANAESMKIHTRIHTGERPFRCGNCQKTFINNSSLNQHMRDHIREETYKCDLCPHKFKRERHLLKHQQYHALEMQDLERIGMGDSMNNLDETLFMCNTCGRVFDKKKYLTTHQNIHVRAKLYSCFICNKQLASKLALRNHHLIHTGEMPFRCKYCPKEFRSSSNLKRHERSHNSSDALKCDMCSETFYDADLLAGHKKNVHTDAPNMQLMMMNSSIDNVSNPENAPHLYVFETVGQVAEAMENTQQLVQQQFLVDSSQPLLVFPDSNVEPCSELSGPENSGDKSDVESEPEPELECEIKQDLEKIKQEVHEPEIMIIPEKMDHNLLQVASEYAVDKPHQCDMCHKSFAKKQYLTKHKYRHREVKPHACDICFKRFAQKFEVAVHKIKHTGEKPYECDICKKPFRSKVNLISHKMRHNGEFPYPCSICHKGFSTQLQLKKHTSMHNSFRSLPYRCAFCQRGYSLKTNLIKHWAKVHNAHYLENDHAVQSITDMNLIESEADQQITNTVTNQESENLANKPMFLSAEDQDTPTMSVLEFNPDYLKDLMNRTGNEVDSKIFHSILQPFPQEHTTSTITIDSRGVVQVASIDN